MKQKKLRNYLEIGVFNGHVFFQVQSSFKVGIDPSPCFSVSRRVGKSVFNPYNLFNQHFKKTSDAFFDEDAAEVYASRPVEIALIDGMHEYAYALRDIEHTLEYLSNDGIIVVHDCNPLLPDQACTFAEYKERGFTGIWNGDVWKAILHLRSHRNDLNVFVLDCDHGLGIIQKGKPGYKLSPGDIHSISFEEFHANREAWLGLRSASYFYEHFALSP